MGKMLPVSKGGSRRHLLACVVATNSLPYADRDSLSRSLVLFCDLILRKLQNVLDIKHINRTMARPILIIEDDHNIAENVKCNLEREGFATVAFTGEQGCVQPLVKKLLE